MAEKMSEVFEMYDVRLDHIGRGRGAMLLQTDKGCARSGQRQPEKNGCRQSMILRSICIWQAFRILTGL